MTNGKKTREAEERAKAAEAEAAAARQSATAKAEQLDLTPEAKEVLRMSGEDLKAARSGDVRNIGDVANYLSQSARANANAKRTSATGAAALATNVANPNLIAMNDEMLDRQAAQDRAADITGIARNAEDKAIANIGNFSGMKSNIDMGALSMIFQGAGLAGNAANSAWDRYKFEKQQKPFWQTALTAGIGAAGGFFTGGFGAMKGNG